MHVRSDLGRCVHTGTKRFSPLGQVFVNMMWRWGLPLSWGGPVNGTRIVQPRFGEKRAFTHGAHFPRVEGLESLGRWPLPLDSRGPLKPLCMIWVSCPLSRCTRDSVRASSCESAKLTYHE